MRSKLKLLKTLVVAVSVGVTFTHSYSVWAHNSPLDNLGGVMMKTRFIGDSNRDSNLTQEEKELSRATGRMDRANGVLLSDCKTVVTAAHVAQDARTGGVASGLEYFEHEGAGNNQSELEDDLYASGFKDAPIHFWGNLYDWSVLQLKNKKNDCGGIEPAFVSKERLMKMKLYSIFLNIPSVDDDVPINNGRADYIKSVQREGCRVVDDDKMVSRPTSYERKDLLHHTCDAGKGNSGHGLFAKIEGEFYLVAVHAGESQFSCPDEPDEYWYTEDGRNTDAYTCPNEAKWISGDFAKSIEKSMRETLGPGWKMKRFE